MVLWAASALAAAIAVVVLTRQLDIARRHTLMVPREVTALMAWRAPTDVLLDIPGNTLLRESPRLNASVLDDLTGGDRR